MSKPAESASPKPDEAADQIADAVHAVMHLYRTQQFRALRDGPHELTHMESRVLGYFSRHPGATQSDLVVHASRDKSQLARLIGALRERGLLEARADEADRRVLRLFLTAEGRSLQAGVQRQRLRVARLAVADLGDDERRQLVALLTRVRANLEGAA